MFFKHIETQPYGTNCYIIADDNKEGVVIDPSGSADEILSIIKENSLKIKYIILTHYHFDHIIAVPDVKSATGASIIIHRADSDGLQDPNVNLSGFMSRNTITVTPDIEAEDNQELKIGTLTLKLIHTPGHTPGGMCVLVNDLLFSGDTLFSLSVGRTDLPNGNTELIIKSIKEKLFALPPNTKVYPGHDRSTDIAREISNNPYIK